MGLPKWDKSEQEMEGAGVTPITRSWPPRCRTWFYVHGRALDPKTGEVSRKANQKGAEQKIIDAIEEARRGEFTPNRENDELTRALRNPKYPGVDLIDRTGYFLLEHYSHIYTCIYKYNFYYMLPWCLRSTMTSGSWGGSG